jgi:hypothetical protein
MKKSKIFYAFILIFSMGAPVLAGDEEDEMNALVSKVTDLLARFPEFELNNNEILKQNATFAEELERLKLKITTNKEEPQFNQENLEREWQDKLNEKDVKIDRVVKLANETIEQSIEQSERDLKGFLQEQTNAIKKDTAKKMSALDQKYNKLQSEFNQVADIQKEIDGLTKEQKQFMKTVTETIDEKITQSLVQKISKIQQGFEQQKNSLEKSIQQNLLENTSAVKELEGKIELNKQQIKKSLEDTLNTALPAYEQRLSELKTTLELEFSRKLENMSNSFPDTNDTRSTSYGASVLEDQVTTLQQEIESLRAERVNPVNLEEITKTIESNLAEKASSEENKTRKEIQNLQNELRNTTDTLRENTRFAMNEVNEMRRKLNQKQNDNSAIDAFVRPLPQAVTSPNVLQRILRK